jgi:phosphohistidine swiveling domain-containing protein
MTGVKTPDKSFSVSAVAPKKGFWQRDEVYNRLPVMPMWRSVFFEPINLAFKEAYREFSFPGATEYRDIGGWGYYGTINVNMNYPAWLTPLVRRAMRPMMKPMIEMVRTCPETRYTQVWEKEWKPRQKTCLAELTAVDLKSLTDLALESHLSNVLMPFLKKSLRYQMILEFAFIVSLARLAALCQEMLKWNDAQILSLVSGLSPASTEPLQKMAGLAAMAKNKPAILGLLENINDSTSEKLRAADAEFAEAFKAYLQDNGDRILSIGIHNPTLKEKPATALHMVSDQLLAGFDPKAAALELERKRANALAEARAALAGKTVEAKELFEKAISAAVQTYPLKEGSEYETMDAPMALMRSALLELGKRMAQKGHLESREDVFFLEFGEALSGFKQGLDRRDVIKLRKAERVWVEAHPGPRSYGQAPVIPLSSFTYELRILMTGLAWTNQQQFAFRRGSEGSSLNGLKGAPASPGRYSGPARIIMNEEDFCKLRSGDVLVCPITTPAWTLLFPKIGAVISNAGGVLSHPAIIAREYGIPAVVAARDATTRLKDGQMVTVDGGTGLIVTIEK